MAFTSRRPPPGELDEDPNEDYDDGGNEARWWDADVSNGRRSFSGFVSREGNERFERLYADSASRMAKIEKLREEAMRERSDRELSYMPKVKKAAAEDLAQACDRLYGEAENRRQRQEKRKQEKEYLEDLHEALRVGGRARSTPNLVRNSESRWERLHAKGAEMQKKLDRERKIKLEEEQKQLEKISIHNKPGGAEAKASFNRLYHDGMQRELRREQRRIVSQENESMNMQSRSVHAQEPHGVTAEQATERLYVEGKLREQRLEMQRKKKEEEDQTKMRKVASARTIDKRVKMLYGDAERRKADREWMQDEYEKEVLTEFLRESVHAHVRQNPTGELERIFERSQRPDAKPSARDRTPIKDGAHIADGAHHEDTSDHKTADHQSSHGFSDDYNHDHDQAHCHGHGHSHSHSQNPQAQARSCSQGNTPRHGHGHGDDHLHRRAKPGDIVDIMGEYDFMPYGENQAVKGRTPRKQPAQGGVMRNKMGRAGQRLSAVEGPAPFKQIPSEAPPPKRESFAMTKVVQDGARTAMSARLPIR